jgi:hypothetical protein
VRRAALLLLLPAVAAAQQAVVGARREEGGVLVGRACVDVDRDDRCGAGEPGVAGALVRFADGRVVTADAAGRFHLLGQEGRLLVPGREAFGAMALAMDGGGARRVTEQAPGGAVAVDLALPPPPPVPVGCAVDRVPPGPPTLQEGGVGWPIAGTVPPAARVLVDGREAQVEPDGRFRGEARLSGGPNTVGLVVTTLGGVGLHALPIHVARPRGGAVRIYQAAPRQLATLALSRGPTGALVTGWAAPGVEVRIAGLRPTPAPDGTFAAFAQLGAEAGVVAVEARDDAAAQGIAALVPLPPAARWAEGLLLGDLELSLGAGGPRAAWRGTGAVSGGWRGLRFDAGLDLDDRDDALAALARPREQQAAAPVPEPARTFLTAGDGSAPGDGNAGRGRVWARAEADGLRLSAGWTRAGLEGEGLGRYERALFGVRADGEGRVGPVRLFGDAFGAAGGTDERGLPPPRAAHQVLLATGGSLFYLAGTGVVAGSLSARAEWRDPHTGLTTAVRPLRRDVDYRLDEEAGRLLLLRPLATVAPPAVLLTGDPFAAAEARLVLDYLDAGQAGAARLAGGRAGAEVGPVALEVRGAAEEGAREPWRLAGAAGSLALGPALQARVEVARTEGRLHEAGTGFSRSADGGFSTFAAPPAEGGATAVHAEAHGEAGQASWRAWWRERPAGYSDEAHLEARAALERGAEAAGAVGALRLRLAVAERVGTDERDPSGVTALDARRAVARAAAPLGPVEVTAELLHERLGGPAGGEQAAAGLRGAWRAAGGLVLEASHTQAFAASGEITAATFTAAGASLAWRDGAIGLRGGWGPELGPRLVLSGARRDQRGDVHGSLGSDPGATGRGAAVGSVLGATSRAGAMEVFTEELVGEDALGLRAGRVVGIAAVPAPGLRLALSAERGERLLPSGESHARGAVGGSATWVGGPLRLAARGELVSEAGAARWVGGGDAAWRAADGLDVTLRALAARGSVAGLSAEDLDVGAGAAWRGASRSVLATVARVVEARPSTPRRDGWVAGLAAAGPVAGPVRLGLAARLALQRVAGVVDDRLSGSVRVEVWVVGPLDVAAEYARRAALGPRVLGDLDALRGEAGATLGPIRLGLGYVLVGYTGDGVTPNDTAGRAFLRATLVL